MAEQQQPRVGEDVTALMGGNVTALMTTHDRPKQRPEQIGAASEPDYMGGDPNLGKRALSNAPTAGAMLGGLLGGVPGAAIGGTGGALLRGDSLTNAMLEGGKQGALELGGGLVVKGLGKIARGFMKGTVPKNIAKEYDQVDIPQEMLDRGVFPGSARSAKRVSGLSKAANAERDAAAQTVPAMPRRKVVAGLRPLHVEAVAAKEPEIAGDMLAYMRKSARDIGPEGLSGPEALARKTVKQRQGRAALNAGNSKEAAVLPQAAEAERSAITSHLRETPRMATALNESQALMAIDDVMKDAALSNPVTRARIGGLTAASMSPLGLGASAHAINQGSRLFNPQVVRMLDLIMRSGAHEP